MTRECFSLSLPVFQIRIHRIHMFLGLPDQEVWNRILLSLSKNSKKNLDSYCFVTSFIFEK